MGILLAVAGWLLIAVVLAGALPLIAAAYEYAAVPVHSVRNHYRQAEPRFPRTAVVIAAWNEEAVIGTTVERFMKLEYPRASLRVIVVDDASTDRTPDVLKAKAEQYPGRVFHLRRERGGEGKAAALNHGLEFILSDDWAQAILIGDADPIYEPRALRELAMHLADPAIGAVTAYIKEGSRGKEANYLTKFIAYEYVTGQAAARRSQNVLGFMQCLAGGAQMHSRENIEALGGRIDNSTLAEDTITTFETQLRGRKTLFEPHAVVWAEEPGSIRALWKQRLRWARGNVQLTRRYRHLWFRRQPGNRLGGPTFGLLWFSLLLQPFFMIGGSLSLLLLYYFVNTGLAWRAFGILWLANAMCYLYCTVYTLLIDTEVARCAWVQAIMFAGVVNLTVMVAAVVTGPMHALAVTVAGALGLTITKSWIIGSVIFLYVWQAGSMAVAMLAMFAEGRRGGWLLSRALLYISGYGALMCAVTLASYVKELTGAEARWDKTEKTGKVEASV
jgi:cellulose synthase/poly-beta-1,6-N-acetylglucosamine synthase-like glycosyltransferase